MIPPDGSVWGWNAEKEDANEKTDTPWRAYFSEAVPPQPLRFRVSDQEPRANFPVPLSIYRGGERTFLWKITRQLRQKLGKSQIRVRRKTLHKSSIKMMELQPTALAGLSYVAAAGAGGAFCRLLSAAAR